MHNLSSYRYLQVLLDYLLWSVPQEDIEIKDPTNGSVGHGWSRLHHKFCRTRAHKTNFEYQLILKHLCNFLIDDKKIYLRKKHNPNIPKEHKNINWTCNDGEMYSDDSFKYPNFHSFTFYREENQKKYNGSNFYL